ncbi:hypothetical protein H6G74_07535 [Nostoc spongiaeforme FACHB-130]|uniref:Uncharacterized protein n=1 Tax=Nostoc spongiaeforme FACHB-130 TaxID=1357510 RepID=A0ABR8FRX2_9NOSO|nr:MULTISPECIES: hypothetical protein [Nostoc]MBD2302946.1 hypothetical protein [Nostoc sp. FACHB-190]MBD2594181.1 hypothetical protein [Nostoc spongiaeforme FACHB-130]
MTDLSKLKWSKNVNYQGDKKIYWDYKIDETSKIFILHWKKGGEANAEKPEEGDLLIIRQHAHVTHVVQFFNDTVYDDGSGYDFSIGRLVQIIWKANDLKNLSHTSDLTNIPHNKEIFGCSINFPPDGKAHYLANNNDFNEHWNKHGGLPGFQNYITGVLAEKGEWLKPLIKLK